MNHIVYLKMCQELTNISKCAKHKVGAILVKNKKIIATGVNGTKANSENCCDRFAGKDLKIEPYKTEHRVWATEFEIHAEMNVLLRAGSNNINGSTLYCSLEPCENCLKHAYIMGVKEIYYIKEHACNTKKPQILQLIKNNEIKIEQIII